MYRPTDVRLLFLEETSPIAEIYISKDPDGDHLAIKQEDGHIYKYSVDPKNPKYSDLQQLFRSVKGFAKYRKAGPVLGWVSKQAILYSGSKKKGAA